MIFASINFCGFSKITVLGYINLWPIIPSIKYFLEIFPVNHSMNIWFSNLLTQQHYPWTLLFNQYWWNLTIIYFIIYQMIESWQVFLPCDCWENSLGSINDKLPDLLIFIWPLLFMPSLPLTTHYTPPPQTHNFTRLATLLLFLNTMQLPVHPTYLNINLPWYQTLAKISW